MLTSTFYRQVHSSSVRANSITKEFALQVHCRLLHGIVQVPTPCSTAAHVIWGHLWYSERTVHCRYIPPAQHSYDYDRVGVACKGRVGGEARGENRCWNPHFQKPAPSLGWKTRSILLLYVLSTCQGGKGLVNSQSTNSVDLNTTAPNLPCYMTKILVLSSPTLIY